MSLEDRLSDALDAAGRAHDRPADLLDGVHARIERERRARRVAFIAGGAATATAAAVVALLLLNRSPAERVHIDPADPTTTSTPTTAPTTTTLPAAVITTTAPPPLPPATFVGLMDTNKIVIADATTGRVIRTLYTHPELYGVGRPTFDPERKFVYFTRTDQGTSRIWRIPVSGGKPTARFPGCGIQFSHDGKKAAIIGGENGCRDGITVRDLETGTVRFHGRGSMPEDEHFGELTWTRDSRFVLFAASADEMPTRVYRLDVTAPGTLDKAKKLGPEGDTAHSWSSAEYMPTMGLVKLIEYCCMVDAEPPPTDTSDVVVIDPVTAKEVDRWRTPEDVSTVAVAANGSSAELYVGSRGELYRREGDRLRKLPGTWTSIDW